MIPPPSRAILSIGNVQVFENVDGSLEYISDAMIDGDGVGLSHNDPDYQPATSYRPFLNADIDRYVVVPPQLIDAVTPVVLGCRAVVTNLKTLVSTEALVGDVGPHNKIGEMSIACANALGISSSPTTGGDSASEIQYRLFPGVPANVNGKAYHLQPYLTS